MKRQIKKPECPYCAGAMRPVAMRCDRCDVEVRANFRPTHFHALPPEDLAFLEKYILAEFNIKTLTETTDLGYVAIRTRLDRIIAAYRRRVGREAEKNAILERLEQGEITAEEAARAIEALAAPAQIPPGD